MSANSDKFLKDFSEQEKKHNKILEESEEKRKIVEDEKIRFIKEFEKLFRTEMKLKLDEIRSNLTSNDLILDYTPIKKTQSDISSFEINISKKTYPPVKIKVAGNSTFRKIDINHFTTSATLGAKKKVDYNLTLQDFTIEKFENIIFEILHFYYISK